MDTLTVVLTALVALPLTLVLASVAMNGALRLVHHISRVPAADNSAAVGSLAP